MNSLFIRTIAFLFYWQLFCSIDSYSTLSIALLFYRQLFCSIDSFSVLSIVFFCSIDSFSILPIVFLFYPQLFCSINVENIFELPSEDENITPEKHVNRDRCSFLTKERVFGVFAIDEPRSPARALYATLRQSNFHDYRVSSNSIELDQCQKQYKNSVIYRFASHSILLDKTTQPFAARLLPVLTPQKVL